MIKKITLLSVLMSISTLGMSLFAQDCAGCTTGPMNGTFDLNGNTTICLPNGSTATPQNINGSNNVLCIPEGSVWEFNASNLNVNNKALTIVVKGTMVINSSNNVTIGAARINVEEGGSLSYSGSHLTFHNTEVNNKGHIIVSELETAETNFFTNFNTGKVTINGRWYQHGGLINFGKIETLCGAVDPGTSGYPNLPACEFLIGDKGSLYFENSGTINITGKVTVGGEIRNTCGAELIVNGNIDINKAVVGSGTLIATTGSVNGDGGVRPNGGTCPNEKPTVYIESTPDHDFNNNNPSNPSNNDYNVSGFNPLPVKLISFYVEAHGSEVALKWTTSEEEDSKVFLVERSLDMIKWEKVGEVLASGNSSEVQHYTFVDLNLPSGTYYYRLKMVDADETFEYSSARTVNIGTSSPGLVYPNPSYGTLFFKDAETIERVYIYDKTGKLIKSVPKFDVNGLDVSDVLPGSYLVRVIYKDKKMQVFNVIMN